MTEKPSLFLSASIPIPGRAPFDTDIEKHRIREAILALVTACNDAGFHLVFGGHPAISPLVDHASRSLGNQDDISIYQSRYFEDWMPKVAKRFPGLVFTERATTQDDSIAIMRDQMITHYRGYIAAVFIGGMKGIEDEFERFGTQHRGKPRFPITSTGGATRILHLLDKLPPGELNDVQQQLLRQDADPEGSLTYLNLFRKLFADL
jgi:hypothetical protein